MMTGAELLAALRVRYAPPEWYLVSEVANGTGYKNRDRHTYADAVAVNAFQSGRYGAEIHGFEIKATRADWLNELKDPGKSEAIQRFCDRFYLVSPDGIHGIPENAGIAAMPACWGWLRADEEKGGIVLKRAIESRLPAATRVPVTRGFLSAIIRRATEEREAREAAKGALLKAPLRQVVYSEYRTKALLLSCGHLGARDWLRAPRTVRCLACVDGLPTAAELVGVALNSMAREDAIDVLRRAGFNG